MKISEKIVLIILLGYCILHLLVLFQLVPYDFVWGGKIESIGTMYILEGVAFVILLFLGVVILMKNGILEPIFTNKTTKKILLIFAIFFMLNTVGNLIAESMTEKCQAIFTLFLAITLFKSSKEIKSL